MSASGTLTLAGHLEELRRRLVIGLAALLLGVGASATQAERIVQWLLQPAQPLLTQFAFFRPTEPLLAYIKVSALAGLIVAMPAILWQLWAFARPALSPRERTIGAVFIISGSALFLLGALFAYHVLLPVSLRVLLGIGRHMLEPVISIDAYLSFVTALAFWCGLVFELPAVITLLAHAGIVTSEWLRQSRPYAILVLVIVAAVVTPTTDPINLCLMALPILGLYELSVGLVKLIGRRMPQRAGGASSAG